MTAFNRRQWLRTAALSAGAALLGGPSDFSKSEVPAYTARPAGEIVKLSSNENPYGPSPKVRAAMQKAFDHACRYPYSYQVELAEELARREGVTKDHILITGGSTEALKITGLSYGLNNGEILAARPTFLAMLDYADQFGAQVNWVPVTDEMTYDLEALEKRITNQTKLVFLCNPNNPTGTIVPADQLRDFCESASHRTVVFSDEAYYDFITEPDYSSMVEMVKRDLNVIVSRTFSKIYGLAGIRIGYLIARPDIIQRLLAARVAFTNIIALSAARAALQDQDFYNHCLDMNLKGKEQIYATLEELGLKYIPSHTNFVFFHSGRDIRSLHSQMLEEGVQIGRPFPPFTDWCRISTGTLEEVQAFCSSFQKVMRS